MMDVFEGAHVQACDQTIHLIGWWGGGGDRPPYRIFLMQYRQEIPRFRTN